MPKTGVLKVNSFPQSVIFIDNKQMGKSPFEDKVPEGEYTLKLLPETSVQQISAWEGKIKIMHNLLTYVSADLTDSDLKSAVDTLWLEKISSKQSEVSVTTVPDGVEVSLDGQSKGISPLVMTDVSPGDHTILLSSAGFVNRTLKIKATNGFRLLVNTKMAISVNQDTMIEASPSAVLAVDTVEITPTEIPNDKMTPTSKVTLKPIASPSATLKTTPTVSDPDKPYAIIKDTPTGFLRVRMEPNTQATEAAKVNPGEKYTIFDSKSGWYKIMYNSTDYGWISGQYVDKIE